MQFIQGRIVAGFLVALCAGHAWGTVTKDQAQELHGGGGYVWVDQDVAQTFMPAIGGYLDHVDVYVDAWVSGSFVMQMKVTGTTPDNKPDGAAVFGQATVPGAGLGWQTLDLRSLNIVLKANTSYALWFTSNDPSVNDPGIGLGANWSPDVYTRGAALKRPTGQDWSPWNFDAGSTTGDIQFRTFMDPVPEPASLTLIVGAAGFGALRRRRRR